MIKERFRPKKFSALVNYILHKCGPMEESKLCWTLFHFDMESFKRKGKSLTGATYIKGEEYPIPCRRSHPRKQATS